MSIVLNGTTGITTPTIAATSASTFTGALALPAGGLNVGSGQLAVDASGRVTMASQPAFSVTNSNNTNFTGTLIFDTTQVNVGGHYNTGNGRFTAPVTGSYYFIFATIVGATGNFVVQFRKNGSNIDGVGYCTSDGNATGVVAKVIYLNAGDYVNVNTSSGDCEPQYSSFCGYLIG
jgi:hypothetical protein